MEKREIRLLDLIHQEAQEAYWSTRNDCGSDVKPNCEPCHYFHACLRSKEIDQILNKLSGQK